MNKDVVWSSGLTALLLASSVTSLAAPEGFSFSGIPEQLASGAPLPITVFALDGTGQPATNWNGSATLRLVTHGKPTPVISEFRRFQSAVEVTNPGDKPIDISNWELQVHEGHDYLDSGKAHIRFPAGSVIPPRGTVVWSSEGTPPGAFPWFVSAGSFKPSQAVGLAQLFDSAGTLVDEVWLSDVTPRTGALWKGVGLPHANMPLTYQRIGRGNHSRNVDWATNAPTFGMLNTGLELPWRGEKWTRLFPSHVFFTNGIWSGSMNLPANVSGTNQIHVDTGNGVATLTETFFIANKSPLQMAADAALANASEAVPAAGNLTVSIPAAIGHDLHITLSQNTTNEFSIPSAAIIPAGQTSTTISATNLDDAIADGTARVVVSASADGYESATVPLSNEDDESGPLTLIVPSSLHEGHGFASEPGRVFLMQPALHDVVVSLAAEPPLEVPAQTVIPRGEIAGTFSLHVGEDQLVNPNPWKAKISAVTGNWPRTTVYVQLLDDEDASFSLILPPGSVEGFDTVGKIQTIQPRSGDSTFVLQSSRPDASVPLNVTLTAGTTVVEFPICLPNNSTTNGDASVQLCATQGWISSCRNFYVADDESKPGYLDLNTTTLAVLSGNPFAAWSTVIPPSTVQFTNLSGHLSLTASASAQLVGPAQVQFTNGTWNGSVQLAGEALDARLQVSASGLEATSQPFDLLDGRDIPMRFTDMVWHEMSGRFLITGAASSNQPAQLLEFDPESATYGRSMTLPRTAARIAVSQDGTVAWLASSNSTLQRIDLQSWLFAGEFPLSVATTNTEARELTVLPNAVPSIAALVRSNQTWRLQVFDNGIARPVAPPITKPILHPQLVAGRNSNEVFFHTSGSLQRVVIDQNGAAVALATNCQFASDDYPSLVLDGGILFRGYGEVFDPDTLIKIRQFPLQYDATGIPFSERGLAVFFANGSARSYRLSDGGLQGSHKLPVNAMNVFKLLRWGHRGLACFSSSRSNLVVFKTPLITSNAPDLKLTVSGPAFSVIPPHPGGPASFSWTFAVTNHSSEPAQKVQLVLNGSETHLIGSLEPSQGTIKIVQRASFSAQIISAEALVTSLVPDAAPADNAASITTRTMKPDSLSAKQLILGMTHLTASPDGTRLYASVARSAGELVDGIAIVDPEMVQLESILPIGSDPRRVLAPAGSTHLLVQQGTNTLVKWNLLENAVEWSLTFTNELILDVVAVPGAPHAFALATTTRVVVFDDLQPRPLQFLSSASRKHLGFTLGELWLAIPGQLRSFTVSASGLTSGSPIAFSLFSDNYAFASDAQRLFFPGAVFDTLSRTIVKSSFLGDQFCIDLPNSVFYSPVGTTLRSYNLSDFSQIGEEWIAPATGSYMQDPVRWGSDGLAIRAGQQLILARTRLVPTNAVTDLAVHVAGPSQISAGQVGEWIVTVTNLLAQPAQRVTLSVDCSQLAQLHIEGPVSGRSDSWFDCDLGLLPAHGSATVQLSGRPQASFNLTARAIAAGSDSNTNNNATSFWVQRTQPPSDAGIHSVAVPPVVAQGDEFEVIVVFTNAALYEDIHSGISWECEGLAFLGSTANYPEDNGVIRLGAVPAKESVTAVLRFRTERPGTFYFEAYSHIAYDSDPNNNRACVRFYAAPDDDSEPALQLAEGGILAEWDASRQQVIAAFRNQTNSILVLEPETLVPQMEIPLPNNPTHLAPCENGRHVWVAMIDGTIARVDLIDRNVELIFTGGMGHLASIASFPGTSNILMVLNDVDWLGNPQLRAFDNGIQRPVTQGGVGWLGGGTDIQVTPTGRIFLASSLYLRELALTPSGFSQIANLDYLAEYDSISLTATTNQLVYSTGRIVNPSIMTATVPLGFRNELAADVAEPYFYSAQFTSTNALLESFHSQTWNPRWQVNVPVDQGVPDSRIIPIGTNGVILLAKQLVLVRTSLLEPQAANVSVRIEAPSEVENGTIFPIEVGLSNPSIWAAPNAQLRIHLDSGLQFAGGPSDGATNLLVTLGAFIGETNFTYSVRASTHGLFSIRGAATHSAPELAPQDNSSELEIAALPPPTIFVVGGNLPEGSDWTSSYSTAWLSRPMSNAVYLSYSIGLTTAQADDFTALSGTSAFWPGSQKLLLAGTVGDLTPEPDESAVISIASTNANLVQDRVTVTLINDDVPVLSVTNILILEGNDGWSNAQLNCSLSVTSHLPAEVYFKTVPGTAQAEQDFLPREGWLHFAPGEKIKTISIPVWGDLDFERPETLKLSFLDSLDLTYPQVGPSITIRNDDLPPPPTARLDLAPFNRRVHFDTIAGATYQLQWRTNLTTDAWRTPVGPPVVVIGDGSSASLPLPIYSGKEAYFRIIAR